MNRQNLESFRTNLRCEMREGFKSVQQRIDEMQTKPRKIDDDW
jgi:hypothetical protein